MYKITVTRTFTHVSHQTWRPLLLLLIFILAARGQTSTRNPSADLQLLYADYAYDTGRPDQEQASQAQYDYATSYDQNDRPGSYDNYDNDYGRQSESQGEPHAGSGQDVNDVDVQSVVDPQVQLLDHHENNMPSREEWRKSSYDYVISGEGFISRCHVMRTNPEPFRCYGSKCTKSSESLVLDVSELSQLTCSRHADCSKHDSQLSCQGGVCLCSPQAAFNITSCRCEPTGACVSGEEGCFKHNGRSCPNKFCSCHKSDNFRDYLIDTPSLFCLLPGSGQAYTRVDYSASIFTGLWIVIAIAIFVFLFLAVLTAFQYGAFQQCTGLFQKGDYRCDNQDTVDFPVEHNPTWDYPSMDYIHTQEEEIVFTLAQAKDFKGASNASTIHVIDENQTYELRDFSENHINKAYTMEGSVESVSVDDPRND